MSFISADQLVAHAVGDYLLQSDWMAAEKTRRSLAAGVHAFCYSLPFLFLEPSLAAFAVIVATHFTIDRWRLARYVVWAKNFLAPKHIRDWVDVLPFNRTQHLIMRRYQTWPECAATGYAPDKPPWLATWLLIIADNTLHVLCNAAALRWLP